MLIYLSTKEEVKLPKKNKIKLISHSKPFARKPLIKNANQCAKVTLSKTHQTSKIACHFRQHHCLIVHRYLLLC